MSFRIGDLSLATSFVGTDEFEFSLAGSSGSRRIAGVNLRKQIFAGGTGFTQTDPLVCGTITTSSDVTIGSGGTGAAVALHLSMNSGSGAGSRPTIELARNSVTKSVLGLSGVANDVITGSVADDLVIRSVQQILFSADGGTTKHLSLSTVGTLTALGGVLSTGSLLGSGYATGAGGTVTQITSKATAVTINKVCGQVITAGNGLAANTQIAFTVTNSAVAVGDTVSLTINGMDGTLAAVGYIAFVTKISAGSFEITLWNITAGLLTNAVNITFSIKKGVTA